MIHRSMSQINEICLNRNVEKISPKLTLLRQSGSGNFIILDNQWLGNVFLPKAINVCLTCSGYQNKTNAFVCSATQWRAVCE